MFNFRPAISNVIGAVKGSGKILSGRSSMMVLVLFSCTFSQVKELPLKALFLEAAVRFITWPTDSTTVSYRNHSVFTIGFFDNDQFARHLSSLLTRKLIKNKPVRFLNLKHQINIDSCDVVLIPNNKANRLKYILAQTKNKPVLTVSSNPAFASQGIILCIATNKHKIRSHINKSAAINSGLKISHHLLRKSTVIANEEGIP